MLAITNPATICLSAIPQQTDLLKFRLYLILKGPRRTGKSTLLFQLLDAPLQMGVDSRRLLYFPFDDPDFGGSFNDLILEFEKQLGREISQGSEVYCFFDEIQHLENWSAYLKKYVDKKWPIKFVVSGSSASLIKQGAESLAGRTIEETILPFNFFEFLLFNNGKLISSYSKTTMSCRSKSNSVSRLAFKTWQDSTPCKPRRPLREQLL